MSPSTHVDSLDKSKESIEAFGVERAPGGMLRNRRYRECLEGDPQNGSRSNADSADLDGIDRWCRFDLTEGHDLERLLWPGAGSGDSTGLLQNCTVDGRHVATVEPI